MAVSLIILSKKYFTSNGLSKIQIIYAFLGLIPSFCAVILVALVLPLLGIKQFSQTGPIFTIPMIAVISYAILKYCLMDVTLIIRQLILIFFYVLFLSSIFVLFVKVSLARHITMNMDSIYLGEIVFWGIILSLIAYRAGFFLELFLDKYIFKGRYDYKISLKKITEDLARLTEIDQVVSMICTSVKILLNLKRVVIAFRGVSSEDEIFVFQIPAGNELLLKEIFGQVRWLLSQTGELAVFEELRRKSPGSVEKWDLEPFSKLDLAVFVGLKGKGEVQGFIGLGAKGSGDIFSRDDLDFLTTLANQAVVAIENSRLYSELLTIKEYTERVLEQLTCGVVTVDNSGTLTAMNAKALTLLDIGPVGVGFRTIEELPAELGEIMKRSLFSGSPVSNLEIHRANPGQSTRFLNVSTTPIRGPKGEMIGALAVLTDLTEIKLLEAEVRRAERLATVGTLAAGMAHEIKNPLVSLKTFAQLLPQKYDDPEFRESFSQIASGEIERINTLVEQLLRFARPPKPIPMPIDLHEPVEQTLALLASEMAKKGIRLTTRFPEKPLLVFADSEQLKQVFMNVLLNALEALSSQEEASLEISTGIRRRWGWPLAPPFAKLPEGYSQGDREAYVRIADNGPGIRENHIKHIFDPFFTTKETGHGLGLSIAHGIVREHKGSINAENRPGGGAVFTIALPLLESEVATRSGDAHELRADRLA